ncbi:amidohydrolase [Micrococcus terreus]|uniref:amidohydrolase n=1 Tax=Micrococcus terreus TaxID=574650 RepID=UPI0021A87088|nr:amidohydrolase [Micrococcus terreus]MCT2090269.1 amidohydrolase [Micrococcus terreus]MDK7700578.1 amidohydrolase [Micrococcus terreus]WOO97639.1 amidohydrolase [Micrococcus terreus]
MTESLPRTAGQPVADDPGLPRVTPLVKSLESDLVAFRRDLHQHPELSYEEHRTTQRILELLTDHGLSPVKLQDTGAYVDIGEGPLVLGLRADIDALPLPERTGLDYASATEGVAHACGHDVHTSVMAGTAIAVHRLVTGQAGQVNGAYDDVPLAGRLRVIFQPAEERLPGGSLSVIRQGVLEGLPRVLAAHCEPRFDVGTIGTRIGAITSASDTVKITLTGRGGHTSRPHLTEDMVYALSQIAVNVPAVLNRRIDVRSAVSVVWGQITAGAAPNAIPSTGYLAGTLRCLDAEAWQSAGELLDEVVQQVAAPYGVKVSLEHVRGVPPVVNTEAETDLIEDSARAELGSRAIQLTPQSMGGEDFAWMTQQVPGSMLRLGTRTPGGPVYDLHMGDFAPDERAIGVGMRIFTAAALRAMAGVQ